MKSLHPAKVLVLGYLFYSILGCFLLSLPICHVQPVSIWDDFFVAISAVSTTGLSTINLDLYNFFGQIVIFLLIQFGGIGYMTFSSFILLCTSGKLSFQRQRIGASSFSLPKDFHLKEFIKYMIIFSFFCELIGAISLSIIFHTSGTENAVWHGIFHSVSAYCTAGLSTFPDGLVSYQYNVWINLIISVLEIIGSIGFIVSLDLYKRWTGEKDHLSFTTRVILVFTFLFLVSGTLFFFLLQDYSSSISPFHEWLIATFQVISATTTCGFNTVDIGSLIPPILILLAFLATFGSSPSGTGGGLKTTTFATLISLVKCTFKGQPVSLWDHLIASKRVRLATAAFIYYIFVMSLMLFILNITEKKEFLMIFFEAINAINNSGLSMGLTPELTAIGKMLISLLMLMGRAGVITFGMAISIQDDRKIERQKAELVI